MVRNIPPATPTRRPSGNLQQRRIMTYVVALIVVVVLVKACSGGHENQYEKVAQGVTLAAQHNDLKGVQSYENAETAADMSLTRVAQAADELQPLGNLKSVHEIKAADAPARGHEFTLTFDKGSVDEKIAFDPQNKIVHFHYVVTPKT